MKRYFIPETLISCPIENMNILSGTTTDGFDTSELGDDQGKARAPMLLTD